MPGARDIIALGDCSRLWGDPLPPTAQVAGQQGAYAARLLNRGFRVDMGGLNVPPPVRVRFGWLRLCFCWGRGRFGRGWRRCECAERECVQRRRHPCC